MALFVVDGKVTEMDLELLKRKIEEVEMINHSLGIVCKTIIDINEATSNDIELGLGEGHISGLNKATHCLYEYQSEKLDLIYNLISERRNTIQ